MIRGFILTGHPCQYKYYIKLQKLKSKEFPELKSIKQLRDNPQAILIEVGTYWLHPIYERVQTWQRKENLKNQKWLNRVKRN